MNALTFISAYRQLAPHEKLFVDGYVQQLERTFERKGERISNALYEPIDPAVVAASGGLLEKPMIMAAITERINAVAASTELTAQRVIKELMHIGFASLGDFIDFDEFDQPTITIKNRAPEKIAAIKKLKIKETLQGREYEIELHPKIDGLDRLAKYMGLLDLDNPFWRQDNARPANAPMIDRTATVTDAANRYAQLIEAD